MGCGVWGVGAPLGSPSKAIYLETATHPTSFVKTIGIDS